MTSPESPPQEVCDSVAGQASRLDVDYVEVSRSEIEIPTRQVLAFGLIPPNCGTGFAGMPAAGGVEAASALVGSVALVISAGPCAIAVTQSSTASVIVTVAQSDFTHGIHNLSEGARSVCRSCQKEHRGLVPNDTDLTSVGRSYKTTIPSQYIIVESN